MVVGECEIACRLSRVLPNACGALSRGVLVIDDALIYRE